MPFLLIASLAFPVSGEFWQPILEKPIVSGQGPVTIQADGQPQVAEVTPTLEDATLTPEVVTATLEEATVTPEEVTPTTEDVSPTMIESTRTPWNPPPEPEEDTPTPEAEITLTPTMESTTIPVPPVVNEITITSVETGYVPNTLTPMQSYVIRVEVSEPNGIGSMEYLVLKLWYDESGGGYTSTDFEHAGGDDNSKYYTINWYRGSNRVSVQSPDSSWEVTDAVLPSLEKLYDPNVTIFGFEFTVRVGKTALETSGNALWQIGALVKDNTNQSSYTPYSESGMPGITMDWYGEVIIPQNFNMDWGKMVPGIGFDDPQSATTLGTNVIVISNGKFSLAAKAARTWRSPNGETVTLKDEPTKPDTFALRAYVGPVKRPSANALLLDQDTFAVDIGNGPRATGEEGYMVKNIIFYLSLSNKISGRGPYSGALNFIVHN